MESKKATTKAMQDERIMAALAHASIILPFWGLIAAIIIWVTQREKSPFVGFQALQGAAYQLVLVLSGFVGLACYMCSFFGMFLLMPLGIVAAGSTGDPEIMGAGGLAAILVSFLTGFFPFCVIGLVLLAGVAFVVYGLYGATRVLQGDDFRYAIIGRKLEQYLNQEEPAA